jgi:hypothetical protein
MSRYATKETSRHKAALGLTLFLWMLGLAGASAQNYTLDWWTVGGGGTSTGGVYAVSGTIGLPAAGTLSGGNYTLQGGFWGFIAAVQSPGAPYLSVTRSNAAVVISWPSTDPSWKVHWTANLGAPPSWTELPPPYATNGANSVFVEPAPTGNRYYQLHKP